jgi:Zn-dependent protease with chaperone function
VFDVTPLVLGPWFVALIACVPGITAWWTGRALVSATADPALPELLMARQQRLLLITATALALLLVLGNAHLAWAIPWLTLSLLAGRYPLRRALLGESNGLGSYLWRSSKSIVGAWGFWALLLSAPVLVLAIDPHWWSFTLALVPLLLVWEFAYIRIWLRLHDAVPLADERLEPRIREIVGRAGVKAPDLYRIGAEGTRVVNALALPSATRPAIGLGNALLELLEPDEVAAIYAHELSHIEQFSPRVIRRFQSVTRLLIVLAVTIPLLARWLMPAAAGWVPWIWPVVVLVVLVQRARKSQQRETESDLRAAALCGDAEAVVRALVKVHVHAFIPRRWPIDVERGATHPSLARRIQALRGSGSREAGSAGEPTLLDTARDGTLIAFDDARAWWFDGVPPGTVRNLESLRAHALSVRSVAWPELVELRLATNGSERALRAEHRNGDSWSVPIAQPQVAALQSALDRVDVRLHRELGKRSAPVAPLIAASTLLVMLVSGQIGILLVPLVLVAFRPSTAALAALGAMAVGRAALGLLLGQPSWMLERVSLGLAALAGMGILSLILASSRVRAGGKRDGVRLTLLVLGGTAALLLAMAAYAALSVTTSEFVELPLAPALAVTLLGGAAVLAISGARRARASGFAVSVAAALTTSPALIAAGEQKDGIQLTRATTEAVEIARVDLGAAANGLRLSPRGTRFVVQQLGRGTQAGSPFAPSVRHIIGTEEGARRTLNAAHIEFLDEDHVFVLLPADTSLELRLERADSAVTLWSARLPELFGPRLVVFPANRSWAIVGTETTTDSLIVLTGNAHAPDVERRRLPLLDTLEPTEFIIFNGGTKLIAASFGVGSRGRLPLLFAMFSGFRPTMQLWSMTGDGPRYTSEIGGYAQCGQPEGQHALCLVRERNHTRVWAVDSSGASMPVSPTLPDAAVGHAGPGDRLTVTNGGNRLAYMDVSAGRLTDVTLPASDGSVYEAKGVPGRLAVLRYEAPSLQLVFYRTN